MSESTAAISEKPGVRSCIGPAAKSGAHHPADQSV